MTQQESNDPAMATIATIATIINAFFIYSFLPSVMLAVISQE